MASRHLKLIIGVALIVVAIKLEPSHIEAFRDTLMSFMMPKQRAASPPIRVDRVSIAHDLQGVHIAPFAGLQNVTKTPYAYQMETSRFWDWDLSAKTLATKTPNAHRRMRVALVIPMIEPPTRIRALDSGTQIETSMLWDLSAKTSAKIFFAVGVIALGVAIFCLLG